MQGYQIHLTAKKMFKFFPNVAENKVIGFFHFYKNVNIAVLLLFPTGYGAKNPHLAYP